jgi:hypothetical protein
MISFSWFPVIFQRRCRRMLTPAFCIRTGSWPIGRCAALRDLLVANALVCFGNHVVLDG